MLQNIRDQERSNRDENLPSIDYCPTCGRQQITRKELGRSLQYRSNIYSMMSHSESIPTKNAWEPITFLREQDESITEYDWNSRNLVSPSIFVSLEPLNAGGRLPDSLEYDNALSPDLETSDYTSLNRLMVVDQVIDDDDMPYSFQNEDQPKPVLMTPEPVEEILKTSLHVPDDNTFHNKPIAGKPNEAYEDNDEINSREDSTVDDEYEDKVLKEILPDDGHEV